MKQDKNGLVGVKEVAEALGVSVPHLYDMVSEGKIPYYRIGGAIRFELKEVVEHCHVQPKQSPPK